MTTMEKYAKPSSLQEAYNLLKTVLDSQVLGGGIFFIKIITKGYKAWHRSL